MKRRILNFYRRRVPLWVKRMIPEAVIAQGAGLAYRLTPHPDLAFFHARHLVRRGRGLRAGQIYHRGAGAEADTPLSDPLFECSAAPAAPEGPTPRIATLATAQFHLEFSYMGLKVLALTKTPAEALSIEIDDMPLRRSRLT